MSKIRLNVQIFRNDTTKGVSKLELHINDIWYGKEATSYEGVTARIDAIPTRNVQVNFDRVITVDGIQTTGTVITHNQFRLHFDPGEQLSLF